MRRVVSRVAVARPFNTSVPTGCRCAAAAAYVDYVQQLNKSYVETRDRDVLNDARRFFESEPLEEVETIGDRIGPLLAAIGTFRPNVASTPALATALSFMQTPEATSSVGVAAAGRVLHTSVVLHVPAVFDVLVAWLWTVVKAAPTMDATTVATCINAYGRAGVQHPALYAALNARALEVFASPPPPMAHIANVLHALSRVKQFHEPLFELLMRHAVERKREASPLVIATLLDACTTVGYAPDFAFAAFEELAVQQIGEFSAPLLASLSVSISKSGRSDAAVYDAIAERGVAVAATFDPSSIAKTLEAYRVVDQRFEDFFGCLAERACRLVPDFRLDEIRLTLGGLAHFELFDPELFPLLGAKVVNVCRGRSAFEFDDVAFIVRCFAKVNERNEDFLAALAPVIRSHLSTMSEVALVDLLFSFATFGIRSELVTSLMAAMDRLSTATREERKADITFIESQFPSSG